MATTAPADLVIRPRDIKFQYSGADGRWWMGNDPVATAYYNAFSASFPQAERYFIDAVRYYRDRAGPELQTQIAGFITQESMHTREHLAFNRIAIGSGYDLSRIEDLIKARFGWARTLPRVRQVASAAALEHFTTILACEAIGNPRHLETAPLEIRRLWCWHACEEIEHKSVAFDTFMLATQTLSPARRWQLRCSVMVASTWYLFDFMFRSVAEFFRQDEILSLRTWLRFLYFAMVAPGVIRRVLGAYCRWYALGFHPWRKDDRHLIAAGERALAQP